MTRQEFHGALKTVNELWPGWSLTDERKGVLWQALGRLPAEVAQQAFREHFADTGRGWPVIPEVRKIAHRLARQRHDPATWTWADENAFWAILRRHRRWAAEGRLPQRMATEEYIIRHVIGKNPTYEERADSQATLLRKAATNRRAVGDLAGAERLEREAEAVAEQLQGVEA